MLGIDLPSHSDDYMTIADHAAIEALVSGGISDFVPVARGQERALDGALMRAAGEWHIGIVVQRGFLLHIASGRTSVIESYRSGPLSHRALNFYRHREQS